MRTKRFALAVLCLTTAIAGYGKDGAPSRLFPYYEDDTGVLRLAQAVHVGTRAEIAGSGRHYRFLLDAGIPDGELGDGRMIVVLVYCCGGGFDESQSLWAYVPPMVTVNEGDFVELRMGHGGPDCASCTGDCVGDDATLSHGPSQVPERIVQSKPCRCPAATSAEDLRSRLTH